MRLPSSTRQRRILRDRSSCTRSGPRRTTSRCGTGGIHGARQQTQLVFSWCLVFWTRSLSPKFANESRRESILASEGPPTKPIATVSWLRMGAASTSSSAARKKIQQKYKLWGVLLQSDIAFFGFHRVAHGPWRLRNRCTDGTSLCILLVESPWLWCMCAIPVVKSTRKPLR